MKYKKLIIAILCLSIAGIGFNSPSAKAMSISDMQSLIQQLQKMVIQLQQQLVSIISTRRSVSPVPTKLCLSSDLYYGMTSDEVRTLQEGLKRDPSVFPPYKGEPAVSTGHFGPKTRAAVIRFQNKYNIRITGQVGPQTRAKFNQLYCYNTTSPITNPVISAPAVCGTLNGKYSMTLAEAMNLFRNSGCSKLGDPSRLSIRCEQCNPENYHGDLYNAIYGKNDQESAWLLDRAAYRIGECIIDVKNRQAYIDRGPSFCTGYTDVAYASTIICAMKGTPQEGWYSVKGPAEMNYGNKTAKELASTGLEVKLLRSKKCSNCQLKCVPKGATTSFGSPVDAIVETCNNSLVYKLGPEGSCVKDKSIFPKNPSFIEDLVRKVLPQLSCTDSDGGDNIYVKGTVTCPEEREGLGVIPAVIQDRCEEDEMGRSTILEEGICKNNYGMTKEHTCSYGCKNGACLRPSVLYKTVWDDGRLIDTLYKSTDDGQHWTKIDSQYKARIIFAFSHENPNIIYDAKTGFNMMGENMDVDLIKSVDGGKTWKNISDAIKKTLGAKGFYKFDSLSINPYSPDVIYTSASAYYGSNNSKNGQEVKLESWNGGNTWHVLPEHTPMCQDRHQESDGGEDYFQQRSLDINLKDSEKEDYCMNSTTLVEYYCSNNSLQKVEYTCPPNYICRRGACLHQ